MSVNHMLDDLYNSIGKIIFSCINTHLLLLCKK